MEVISDLFYRLAYARKNHPRIRQRNTCPTLGCASAHPRVGHILLASQKNSTSSVLLSHSKDILLYEIVLGNQTAGVWCEVVLSGVPSSMDQIGRLLSNILITYVRGLLDSRSWNFGDTSEINSDCLSLEAIIADAKFMIITGFGVIICLIRG